MRILVTGGAGFVGSHLATELVSRGHRVLVLDNLSTGRYENIEALEQSGNLQLVVDSVIEPQIVDECVKQCDAVFHLASAVGVRLIIEQPVRTIESIVGGTDVVLRSCARYRRPFLLTSTSEVYGTGTKVPFSEDDDRVMGATSKRRWSYACAKALDEFLALAHWYESRLPVRIVRLFNTVGPRQTGQYGMVIPTLVRQALGGQPLTVYGDGQQSRCFGHVSDIARGMADLMECDAAKGKIVNLGNDQEITILALAQRIRALTGTRSEVVLVPYEEAYGEGFDDMRRRVPDLARAKSLIGFQPTLGLDQILQDVIAFEKGRLQAR